VSLDPSIVGALAGTEFRRRYTDGPPLIIDPVSKVPVEYRRPSSFTVKDRKFLEDWQQQRVAVGVAGDTGLARRLLQADASGDTKKLRSLAKDAARLGGATAKADLGTAWHTELELSITHPARCVPVEFAVGIAAIGEALRLAGLTVVPELVERMVVNDTLGVAGTFDLAASDGEQVLIGDLKSGRVGSFDQAIQLATYASMEWLFTPGRADDGSEDVRVAMPKVSQTTGFILELDTEKARCRLHWVDLEPAHRALGMLVELGRMERLDVFSIARPAVIARTELLAKQAAVRDRHRIPPADLVSDDWRGWAADRISKLIDLGQADLVAECWPAGVPTLKSGDPIWIYEGELIAAAIATAERNAGQPFPDIEPGAEYVSTRPAPPARHRGGLVEGDLVDDTAVLEANRGAARLTAAAKQWVGQVLDDAHRGGRPIKLSGPGGRASTRRWLICKVLVDIAENEDDQLAWALLARVGVDLDSNMTLGRAFGSLTISEATRLGNLATALRAGQLVPYWDESGCTLAGDLDAAAAA
jgi:hypothetical protein